MSGINSRFRLFFAGAITVIAASILAASIEGLAYVTHWTTIFGPTSSSISFYPFTFGFHANTWVFVVCILGGVLGLLYSLKKQAALAFVSLLFTSIGLLMPLYIARITIPESQYFDLPWIGSYLILVGFSLMLLSFVSAKLIHRMAVPLALLIAAYAVYPVFVLTNFLPYFTLEPHIAVYPIVWVCTFTCTLTLLSLLVLAYKTNAIQWINTRQTFKNSNGHL